MANQNRRTDGSRQPDAFDVLNRAFAEQDEEIRNKAKVDQMRLIYDLQQENKAREAAAAEKAKNVGRDEKKAARDSDGESGEGCLGCGFKLFLVALLSLVLAWLVFMPDGSLQELWQRAEDVLPTLPFSTASSSGTKSGKTGTVVTVTQGTTTAATAVATTTAATTTAATTTAATTTAKKTTAATEAQTTATAADAGQEEDEDINAMHIIVYLKSQITVVYDENGDVLKAFTCSTGKASTPTRTGTYKIRAKYRWRLMIGNCYTQYASSISSSYLLHSIPYNRRNPGTMSNACYDKLGSPASSGCVRLCFRDSKWVYDNCPIGTVVKIVDEKEPDGVDCEPILPRIDDETHRGWDPTDESWDNPYND